MIEMKNGQRYSFNTIAPAILGLEFKNVLLEGTISYRLAKQYQVDHVQASLLAYIPDGMSKKHQDYLYYVFRTDTGSEVVFAYEWLVESSIVTSTESHLDIRIQGATTQDLRHVKTILGYGGFNNVTILE